MSERNGVIRVAVASVICAAVFVAFGIEVLFGTAVASDLVLQDAELQSGTVSSQPSNEAPPESVSSVSSSSASSETNSTKQESQSVAVSTGGKVLGAVRERFITPYTANTSYGKVYLKNSTDLDIDIKSLLAASLPYKIEKNGEPQVLIMHTHTTESFLLEDKDSYTSADASRSQNSKQNMVALGEKVASILNAAGINTVHDKTVHDYPEYNGSYTRSAATVKKQLKAHPSIKVVIDMHRDAIAGDGTDKVKPVVEINGKKAAQVMLVMGSQNGTVKNHPDWKENLKLAVRLQQQLESAYPTLARALSLMPRLYNQNLTTGSILLEMGTEANSFDEVMYSAELVGNALVKTLSALK